MAGHSKWANIKHRKQAVDNKKSHQFQKITQEIIKVARKNSDIKTNPELRAVVARAQALNMPKAKIERAIARQKNSVGKEKFLFGGLFQKKINLLIEMKGEDKNQTEIELKKILKKSPIEILPTKAINHFFYQEFSFFLPIISEDQLLEIIKDLETADFHLLPKKIIIKLKSPSEASTLQTRCNNKAIEIFERKGQFLSFQQITISEEELNLFNHWKKIILANNSVTEIFSDLKTIYV